LVLSRMLLETVEALAMPLLHISAKLPDSSDKRSGRQKFHSIGQVDLFGWE